MIRLSADDPTLPSLFTTDQLAGLRKLKRVKRGKRAGKLTTDQELELGFEARGLTGFSREYTFAWPERAWRFDFAWVQYRLAVEYEGLIVMRVGGQAILRGRHATMTGIREDMVKYNDAAMRGWTVLRYERDLVRAGAVFDDVTSFLTSRGFVPCLPKPLHSIPDL